MQITSGKINRPERVTIYGTEGIGKSTLASCFPKPLFIDTEGSTEQLEISRTKKPLSWTALKDQVKEIAKDPMGYKTLVIDSIDWAERLCIQHVCAESQNNSIEDFGWGKGYVVVGEEFAKLLDLLSEVQNKGLHIVMVAHSHIKRFELPDEVGGFDRYEMKLGRQTTPLIKEYCSLILFCNYKTIIVKTDGKNKPQGGQRVMYTTHHNCWDAKNRHGLPDEVPMKIDSIAHLLSVLNTDQTEALPEIVQRSLEVGAYSENTLAKIGVEVNPSDIIPAKEMPSNFPGALWELMDRDGVTDHEVRQAVAFRGVYPVETLIEVYDQKFIDGVLVAAWDQVHEIIKTKIRK